MEPDEDDEVFRRAERNTAPLRLQSALRPEPIEAAITGNYSLLGTQLSLLKPCQFFHTGVLPVMKQAGLAISSDPSLALGAFLLNVGQAHRSASDLFKRQQYAQIRLSSDLLRRQARVVHLGNNSRLPMSTPSFDGIPTEIWGHTFARSLMEDWLSCYIDHADGKELYRPSPTREVGTTMIWEVIPGQIEFYLFNRSCGYALVNRSIIFLPMNTARAWYEVVASRTLVMIAAMVDEYWKKESRLPWNDLMDVWKKGDWVLATKGNPGYDTIKCLEGTVIGSVSSEDDDNLFFDKDRYLKAVTANRSPGGRACQDEFYDKIEEIVRKNPSRHSAFQLFGLFRTWGYPHVNVLGGIRKVKEIACKPTRPDLDIALDATCMAKEIFFMEYYKKQGHFPPSSRPFQPPDAANKNRKSEVLEALSMGRVINISSRNYDLLDWQYVIPKKLFDASEHLEELDLMSDRACSGTASEIVASLSENPPHLPKTDDRRTLTRYLETESVDVPGHLNKIDSSGFPKDDLVIGVTPKERELKIDPRLFSLMTPGVRLYFTATEHLMKECILPYYPAVAMGLSAREAKDMLNYKSALQGGEGDDFRLVANNMDFQRWNLYQRKAALKGLFSFFDQLFGYTNVFGRTHEVFEESLFYLADGFILPLAEAVEKRQTTDVTWTGHLGGMEGLRQKGWTVLTACLIKLVDRRHNFRSDLMGQGDNQILTTTLSLKRYGVEGGANPTVIATMRDRYKEFLDDLERTFLKLCLPLKVSECWQSSVIFAFGKETLWKNKKMSMSLKRISRMYFLSNEFHPSFYHSVASVYSNAEAACDQDNDVRTPLFIALYELVNTIKFYWKWTPTGGRPLSSCLDSHFSWYDPEERKTNTTDSPRAAHIYENMAKLAEVISLSSHDFGGYACQNYYSLSVRGFTDMPSLQYGFAERYLTLNRQELDPRVYKAILSHYTPRIRTTLNPLLPAQNPYGLNIPKPVSFTMIAREASGALMRSGKVRNRAVRALTTIADTDQDELLRTLMELRPLMPKLINLIYENTPIELAKQVLSKFESSVSVKKAAARFNVRDAMSMEQRIGKADTEVFNCFIGTLSLDYCEPLERDVFKRMQELRTASYGGIPVAGVTSPPPFSYMEKCTISAGECPTCYLGVAAHTSAQVYPLQLSLARAGRKKGPCSAYEGSETKQKISSLSSHRIENITGPIRAVKKTTGVVGWLTSTRSELCEVIRKVVESLTSVPFVNFVAETVETGSSSTHRLQDTHGHHHGSPGTLSTPFTCCDVSTNPMGQFADGEQDHPINYQHLICMVQLIATETATPESETEIHHYHVYNEGYLPPLDDAEVAMTPKAGPLIAALTMPKWEDNKFVYARQENVSLRFKPTAFAHHDEYLDFEVLTAKEKGDIFDILCAQQIVRAIEYSISQIHTGAPPAPSLPYVWYSRCNPMRVLELVISRLPATVMGEGWSMYSERIYANDVEQVAWNETMRMLSNSPLAAFQPVAGMLAIESVRRKILPHVTASEGPRAYPFTNSQLQQSAKRILIGMMTRLRTKEDFRFSPPYTHSLLEDNWTVGLFIKNSIGHLLQMGPGSGMGLETSVKKHIAIVSRMTSQIYDKYTRFGPSAFRPETIRRLAASFLSKLPVEKRTHLCEGLLQRCVLLSFGVTKLQLSQGSIKKIAPEPTKATSARTVNAPSFFPSSHLLHEMPLRPTAAHKLPMPDETLESSSMTYRMTLRCIRNPTLAWYKYLGLLEEAQDKLDVAVCVGDGTGGVAHMVGLLNRGARIYFNSLLTVESGATASHTDNYPVALENGLGLAVPVKGLSPGNLEITDLRDKRWPAHYAKILAGVTPTLITCDANYGEAQYGIRIFENLLTLLRITHATGAMLIMKVYFKDIWTVNRMIQAADAVFQRVSLYRSGFSAAGATESFLVCRGYQIGQEQIPTVLNPNRPALTRSVANKCIADSFSFEANAESASREYIRWAAAAWGPAISLTTRMNLLGEFGMTDDPKTWMEFCSLVNRRSGLTLDSRHLQARDQNEIGSMASMKKLTLLGGALILGRCAMKYGGLTAIEKLAHEPREWLGFVAGYEGKRDTVRVWISSAVQSKEQIYRTLCDNRNTFGKVNVTFFSIPAKFWESAEAEPIYRLYGMYLGRVRGQEDEHYPPRIHIGNWSKKNPSPLKEYAWQSVYVPKLPRVISFSRLE